MASYSSLFTWGLLSERATPSSTPTPSPTLFSKFRKSSLPSPSRSAADDHSSMYLVSPEEDALPPPEWNSSFFFSVQQAGRDTVQLRSFLSLDLAEPRSMASVKHRRTESSISPTTIPEQPEPLAPVTLPRALEPVSPTSHLSPSPLPSSSRRPSRDSLRCLPSPKPAPSVSLPQVPSLRFPLPPVSSEARATMLPALSPTNTAWTNASSCHSYNFSPSVTAPPSPSSPTPSSCIIPFSPNRLPKHCSFLSTGTSVRTAGKRKVHRSDALACLEGRSRSRARISRQRNFMNMSEEDEDEEESDVDADADVEDELDDACLLRMPALAAPSPTPLRQKAASVLLSPTAEHKAEGRRPRLARRGTSEAWFPLVNFLDFRDDDLPGWRSIVELASSA